MIAYSLRAGDMVYGEHGWSWNFRDAKFWTDPKIPDQMREQIVATFPFLESVLSVIVSPIHNP